MFDSPRVFVKQNQVLVVISALFIGWALAFIYHSSYIASDGRRYFNLFDDAMISMRYAWNFSHGNGLVWNPGQRVEGYTNLLMTLVMSLATLLFEKRYAVLAIQLTGIFFSLGAAFLALNIFQILNQTKERIAGYLLFALILLYYPLNFWSLMGMETGLLAVLLAAGVLCSLKYAETLEQKHLWWMSIHFGLAFLTRNDSMIFAALGFFYLLPTLKQGQQKVYLFLAAGLLYSAFVLGQSSFRLFYYGEIVPNTYILKLTGMALGERLQNGIGFTLPFLKETGVILLVAITGLILKPTRERFCLFGLFLASVAYQIYVGGDAWNYWRMTSATMPFLLLLFAFACFEIADRCVKTKQTQFPVVLALSLIGMVFANFRFAGEFLFTHDIYQNNYARAHVEAAIALADLTDEEATIGVFWGGTLPYYLDRKAIDFLGKSDPYIASLPPDVSGQSAGFGMNSMPGHNKYDLTYSIQTLMPTYVQEFDWGTQKLSAWAEDYYVRVKYNDAKLYLLKVSPDVKWDKVKIILQW
ncbi:MAG: hypothetical protein HYZ23_09805 [Chloroflexi bacterium]|nr:hypothetical protein [Chloroflexota bacterium]